MLSLHYIFPCITCPVGHSSGWKMAASASWTSSTGAIWWTYTSWISTCKHVIWSVSKHCRFVAPFIVQHISAARYSLQVPTPSVRLQLYFATANWFHLTIMEKMTRLQALTFRAPFHHRGLARCRIGWSQDSQSFHILPAKMISGRIDFAAVRPSQLVLLSKSFLNGTKSGRLSRLLKSATQWGARCDYTYIDHLWSKLHVGSQSTICLVNAKVFWVWNYCKSHLAHLISCFVQLDGAIPFNAPRWRLLGTSKKKHVPRMK